MGRFRAAVHLPLVIYHWSFVISRLLAQRSEALREDRDQLLGLPEQSIKSGRGLQERYSSRNSKPVPRLLQLLEYNANLVSEVASGFGSTGLFVVRSWRRSRSEELSRDVTRLGRPRP